MSATERLQRGDVNIYTNGILRNCNVGKSCFHKCESKEEKGKVESEKTEKLSEKLNDRNV